MGAVVLWRVSLSAVALAVNQLLLDGSGIGPGPSLGLASLAIQAVVIVLVARGSAAARWLVVFWLAIAALPLPMVGRLVAERSYISASYTLLGFLLKGVATLLLFTGSSQARPDDPATP